MTVCTYITKFIDVVVVVVIVVAAAASATAAVVGIVVWTIISASIYLPCIFFSS